MLTIFLLCLAAYLIAAGVAALLEFFALKALDRLEAYRQARNSEKDVQ